MVGGFKIRKIPRELMLDPPPTRGRWMWWLVLVLALVVTGWFAVNVLAVPLDAIASGGPLHCAVAARGD